MRYYAFKLQSWICEYSNIFHFSSLIFSLINFIISNLITSITFVTQNVPSYFSLKLKSSVGICEKADAPSFYHLCNIII